LGEFAWSIATAEKVIAQKLKLGAFLIRCRLVQVARAINVVAPKALALVMLGLCTVNIYNVKVVGGGGPFCTLFAIWCSGP
jgi:hypothetical protein